MSVVCGTLYVVATPIGNLQDMSGRGQQVLAEVDRIYAEDTRHTGKLLGHYGIKAKLVSLHDHNESERISQVISFLKEGGQAALVSDAGTPLISDPGYKLMEECHRHNVPVSPVPGASALIAALSVSGLPTDSFTFLGFPPAKQEARKNLFCSLAEETRTLVFYESRHRILTCLDNMAECFGPERQVMMARELTKTFETIKKSSLEDMLEWVQGDPNQQKGEYVLIVSGAEKSNKIDSKVTDLLRQLLPEMSVKQAARIVADFCEVPKNQVYKLALTLKE